MSSRASSKKGLYDSYIRAIRWASDRIGQSGVIGYVTNASFLEAGTTDGLRRCLAEEFSSIYVLHLRGNQRTSGDLSRKEGGKVFGGGSRAPIAISILVKSPMDKSRGGIFFYDIGDYLTREEKLERVARWASIAAIREADGWAKIIPDEYSDWLKQRDRSYQHFMTLGKKDKAEPRLFENFSLGVATGRDAWCYNASRRVLTENIHRMVDFYAAEVRRFSANHGVKSSDKRHEIIDQSITVDRSSISWNASLKASLARLQAIKFINAAMVPSLYRPFTKCWMYFDRQLNERVYQMPQIFPDSKSENIVVGVSASETRGTYSVLITNCVPSLHATDMIGSQYFPLYLYDEARNEDLTTSAQSGLFDVTSSGIQKRRDAITDEGLSHFSSAYPGESISKADIFYYVYGLLHSPDYRENYADNLGKELPRIPRVKTAADFWAFSNSGRALAELHLNYETVAMYAATVEGATGKLDSIGYRVEKMKYGGRGKDKDRTTIIYNNRITVTGIPLEAYGYVVNGKPAIEWVMERQCVKTDKDSGIINDANDWAIETRDNPRYPLELLLRVITVSLETTKIVKALPRLEILTTERETEGAVIY